MINILISVALLIVATLIQWKFFKQTQKTRRNFKDIFPEKLNSVLSSSKDEDSGAVQIEINGTYKPSSVFSDIVSSINHYLSKNKGAAEFAILKDITDRNCDAVEEQIEATSPFPIYVGLCGTLIGIVFGVAVLGYGGGIDSLLSSSTPINAPELSEIIPAEDAGATGIKDLLRGVAVAMLTTFVGVCLTIWGSTTSKNASRDNEKRKNDFLSWMQGELLPQMNNSMVKTLDILQRNLTRFNDDFAENSRNLNEVFTQVNTTYEGQAEVLRLVENLKINDIATANIRVLQELRQSTDKINLLQEFLDQSNHYLSSVDALNGRLSDHYDRTQLIENMGKFFMSEIQQIEQRKAAISRSVGEIDLTMQRALEELSKHTQEQYNALTTAAAKEHNEFLKAIDEQRGALEMKLAQTTQIVEELKNLVDVKESMGQLVVHGEKHESQLEELLKIKGLLEQISSSKFGQEAIAERIEKAIEKFAYSINAPGDTYSHPEVHHKTPIWIYVVVGITCTTIVGTCIFYIYNTLP